MSFLVGMVDQLNFFVLYLLPKKIVMYFNMFYSSMENWIFYKFDHTFIIIVYQGKIMMSLV